MLSKVHLKRGEKDMNDTDRVENFYNMQGGKAKKILYAAKKRLSDVGCGKKDFLTPQKDILPFSTVLKKLAVNPEKMKRILRRDVVETSRFYEILPFCVNERRDGTEIPWELQEFDEEFTIRQKMVCLILEKLDKCVYDDLTTVTLTPYRFFEYYGEAVTEVMFQGMVACDPNTRIGIEYYRKFMPYYELISRDRFDGMQIYAMYGCVVRMVFAQDEVFREKCLALGEIFAKIFADMEIESRKENISITETEEAPAVV
jgi:hypothetical protein